MKFSLLLTALLSAVTTSSNPTHAAPVAKPSTKAALVIQGRVKASTKPPRPGSVPYKDAVIALHLTNVKAIRGKAPREIVVLVWGMRANRWTSAATIRRGQSVTLRLTPWERAERKYGRYNRFELQDEATFDLNTYWGE